jgi:hypothetical protein
MRTRFRLLSIFLIWPLVGWAANKNDIAGSPDAASAFDRLPVAFEADQQSSGKGNSFIARGPGYGLFLSPGSISLSLQSRHVNRGGKSEESGVIPDVVTLGIMGGSSECTLEGEDELAEKINYFVRNDPAKWRTGVSTFGRVKYKNVYPGIDLIFYGMGRQLEYDLIVHPGADPKEIAFSIPASASASLSEDGSVTIAAGSKVIRFKAPTLYQETVTGKDTVEGRFQLAKLDSGKEKLFFTVKAYDHSRNLIIDPILDYSTYLGGSSSDFAGGIAVDATGNAYVVGWTSSMDFPVTANAVFPTFDTCAISCYDTFVAKINMTENRLEFATYLGGSGPDYGIAIAVDSLGNAYVAGTTTSTDFPTTSNALQRSCGGTCFRDDIFVTKLNSKGSALVYSTYLGGEDEDSVGSIALHGNNLYIAGFSASSDFPATSGALKTEIEGQGSSFVVKLNSSASALVFGTFLGEVDLQGAASMISVDSSGDSYVAGITLSPNFPRTSGAFHTPFLDGSGFNSYILKLNSSGSKLLYSAQIGGIGASGLTVDDSGNAYVSASAGTFFPVTPGAVDQACDNGALILKLNPTGASLLAAAHLCPDRFSPLGVAFDAAGNIVFGGNTDSPDLPTTTGSFMASKPNECCFSAPVLGKLSRDGRSLIYLTYLGGSGSDNLTALSKDSSQNIYLVGGTSSTDFPIVNGFQTSNAGGDAFFARVVLPNSRISISPASLSFVSTGIGLVSQPAIVTIANLSAVSLSVTGLTPTGDYIIGSNTCGPALPAGAHCQVAVLFKPSATGNRTGKLTIIDSVGTQRVKLTGTGISGSFAVFSTPYQINTAFGIASPPFPITITNTGNKPLSITQFGLSNGPEFNFGDFGDCFNPIAPMGSCTLTLTYNAGFGFGQGFSTLTVTDNASNSPQFFGVQGNSLGSGLIFATSAIRFGQQAVGTRSAVRQVTLINGTGGDVAIGSIKGVGSFAQTHTCDLTLAAGGYCFVNVVFKPTAVGITQGSIAVIYGGSETPVTLPLMGTGN